MQSKLRIPCKAIAQPRRSYPIGTHIENEKIEARAVANAFWIRAERDYGTIRRYSRVSNVTAQMSQLPDLTILNFEDFVVVLASFVRRCVEWLSRERNDRPIRICRKGGNTLIKPPLVRLLYLRKKEARLRITNREAIRNARNVVGDKFQSCLPLLLVHRTCSLKYDVVRSDKGWPFYAGNEAVALIENGGFRMRYKV